MKKAAKLLYNIYVGFGCALIAFIAVSVMVAVILRYFFGISFADFEGLIALVFAFSVFWGIGACILEDDHIKIDVVYNMFPQTMRRGLDIFNVFVMMCTNFYMVYLSIPWIRSLGETYSVAIQSLKMKHIYSAFPVGFAVGGLCALIKLVLVVSGKDKDVQLKPDVSENDITMDVEIPGLN